MVLAHIVRVHIIICGIGIETGHQENFLITCLRTEGNTVRGGDMYSMHVFC